MNSKKSLLFIAIAAIFVLSSCSGLKNACTTNCGGTGNATLSLTISDTPPTNTSVVSFSLPIIGITLTPSSGSAVSVFSSNPSTDFELTRLQTDTNLVAANVTIRGGNIYSRQCDCGGPFRCVYQFFRRYPGPLRDFHLLRHNRERGDDHVYVSHRITAGAGEQFDAMAESGLQLQQRGGYGQ